MTVYVFGAGGHARVIASALETAVTFIVEKDAGPGQILESEIFARPDDFRRDDFYVGIGDNGIRRRLFERAVGCGFRLPVCRARNAFVAADADIGAGTVILAGAVVGTGATIGRNAIVNTLSSVDHDCVLGDHSYVTPGVTFAGNVKAGSMCFFGIKTAVIPGITIGNNVTALAGSLITRDVPDNATVGGSPARIVRKD